MTSTVPPDGASLHRYPGTSCLGAWLLSTCPSGTKAIRPSKRHTMILALMGDRGQGIGVLEYWTKLMGCWSTGLMGCWSIGVPSSELAEFKGKIAVVGTK
jgi:hypothetical protein